MKRKFFYGVASVVLLVSFAGLLFTPSPAQQTNFPGTNIPYLGAYVVSKLPSSGIPNPSLAFATDSSAGSCTSGSSTTLALCQWNGSVWAAVGVSSSGAVWGSITGTLSNQTDLESALNLLAPLASPTLTGTPAAPTAATSTNTTQVATTAYVRSQLPGTQWTTISTATNTASLFTAVANRMYVWGIILPYSVTFTKIGYEVGTTADNTSATYDLAFYTGTPSGTCTLAADLGATAGTTFAPGTSAVHTPTIAQSSVTLPAGRIYVGTTTSQTGTPATLFGGTTSLNSPVLTAAVGTVVITTGGTAPGTFTCPADSNSGMGASLSSNAIPWLGMLP